MVSAPARPIAPRRATPRPDIAPLHIRFNDGELTLERLLAISEANPAYRFERHGKNELVITMGSGIRSDARSLRIGAIVLEWSDRIAGGIANGAQALSESEDGSVLIADASWMSDQRLALSGGDSGEGTGVVPEFVVEVVSWTDRISVQKRKMERWIERGVLLGWLIDPYDRIVWVYRPGREPEELHEPDLLAGDPELPGLVVPLHDIWAPRED